MSSASKFINQEEHQIENWNTFLKYHAYDWHGIVTRYSPQGEIIESFKCIRSFCVSSNGKEYVQKNHYIYDAKKSNTITFDIKHKPITKALYIENSFSWCSGENRNFTDLRFEIGFRHENKRATAGGVYKNMALEHIFIIYEYLNSFSEDSNFYIEIDDKHDNWAGESKEITSDLEIVNKSKVKWEPIESTDEYIFFSSPEGVSITYPSSLEAKSNFVLAVDWLAEPNLKLQSSRYYDDYALTKAQFIEFHQK